MFKVICECDICNYEEPAMAIMGPENNLDFDLPESWTTGTNRDVHLCPECSRKLKGEKYNAGMEF